MSTPFSVRIGILVNLIVFGLMATAALLWGMLSLASDPNGSLVARVLTIFFAGLWLISTWVLTLFLAWNQSRPDDPIEE